MCRYNVFKPGFPDGNCYPLASHFVSVYLPMGHIKSVEQNDEKFEKKFRDSSKNHREIVEAWCGSILFPFEITFLSGKWLSMSKLSC